MPVTALGRQCPRPKPVFANPKSSTFGSPSPSMRDLPGFRSRWMMPRVRGAVAALFACP